jgi:hypothetical protein
LPAFLRLNDMRKPIALLVVMVAVAACGRAEPPPGSAGTGPDDPVVSSPDDTGDVPAGSQPQRVVPRPGMKDVRPVPWDKARSLGERSVLIRYWSGVEPCNVLDRVDVEYGTEKVTVTLFEGHDPRDEDTACIEIALLKAVEVDLAEPLGGRRVVDGAGAGGT